MVVDLNDNDAVVRYTREHASMGLAHVTELVRAERDAMMALIGDLTLAEADERIDNGAEYSISMVLQHLNQSFERSQKRIWTLSQGQPFVNTGGGGGAGGLPQVLDTDFDRVRRRFLDGMNAILEVLEQADESMPSDITAPHPVYGRFNWLEWACYSHHVHTSDHVEQVQRIKSVLRKP
jgi:hypothetical protein